MAAIFVVSQRGTIKMYIIYFYNFNHAFTIYEVLKKIENL